MKLNGDIEDCDIQTTVTGRLREWMSLDPEVLTLSIAMLVFSLAMQMTGRFIPEYLSVLGASAVVVGFYGTFEEMVNSVFPYLGGVVSDRVGTRLTLTMYGLLTALGFSLWVLAPWLGNLVLGPLVLPSWLWIFVGLVCVLGWKELGLGATFALVKDAVAPGRLARGFASTEVFRRVGFLVGPLIASGLLWWFADFVTGFQVILLLAVAVSLMATVLQVRGYRVAENRLKSGGDDSASEDGDNHWWETIIRDVRMLPDDLKPLLIGDTFVRFANGMVYAFFVLVVTRYHEVGLDLGWLQLSPPSFFGLLLAVEMTVALLIMIPAARVADALGQKPVVAFGFFIYAVFPVLFIYAPSHAGYMIVLFAISGLRFAGMPAHKAAIVGPATSGKGGATTGIYYFIRNTVKTPGPAIGGFLYEWSPRVSFTMATIIGLTGVVIYVLYGTPFRKSR